MKKIILGMLVLASLANAGMWSTVSGMTMKEIKPTSEYTVDTAGFNPRVYEFDTRTKPIMHCVVMMANSNKNSAPTMQCVKKH